MLDRLFLTFLLALLLASLLTPLVRKGAARLGRVSPPNPAVDGHNRPTPYVGGLAVFLAVLPFILFCDDSRWTLGVVMMMGLGLVDDLWALSPAWKVLGQAAAATSAAAGGIAVQATGNALLDGGLTVLWLVWITNAFNVIDVMDGLAAGVGGVASLGFAVGFAWLGQGGPAVLATALSGALLGFLIYNFHPAKIFMGDTGSLFAGCLLGCLALGLQRQGHGIPGFVLLGFPLFEAVFLVLVRHRGGRRWYLSSRDHTAQRLVQMGWSIRGAVLVLYCVSGVCAGLALLCLRQPRPFPHVALGMLLAIALLSGWRLSKVQMRDRPQGSA